MSASSRKNVAANANNLTRVCHIQQISGTSDGQGGKTGGGTWSDVPGLSHVPFNYKTWTPWSMYVAQQSYPGVNVRIALRYRKSVNITPVMRLVYGSKIYWIRGMDNYDQANAVVFLYCEEMQSTGSGH